MASNTTTFVHDVGNTEHMRYISQGHQFQHWQRLNGDYIPSISAMSNHLTSMTIVNGKVGIGTTQPTYKLQVDGDVSVASLIVNGNAITSEWASGINGIYTSCNVGIGTSEATKQLHIGGGDLVVQDGSIGIGTNDPKYKLHVDNGDMYVKNNILASQLGLGIQSNTDFRGNLHIQPIINPYENLVYVANVSGSGGMVVANDGRVGIGTLSIPSSSSSDILNINGSIVPTVSNIYNLGGTGRSWSNIYASDAVFANRAELSKLLLYNSNYVYSNLDENIELVRFATNYKQRMDPSFFKLSSSIYAESPSQQDRPKLTFTACLRTSLSNIDILTLTDKSIGIGTTNPLSRLHIHGGDTIVNSNLFVTNRIGVGISSTTTAATFEVFSNGSTDPLRINNSSNEVFMIMNSRGNVGIGTTVLSQRFVVAGNVAPSSNAGFDLGTPSSSWKALYIAGSGNTSFIDINGVRLLKRSDLNGGLVIQDVNGVALNQTIANLFASGTLNSSNLNIMGNQTSLINTFTQISSNLKIDCKAGGSGAALTVTSVGALPLVDFVSNVTPVVRITSTGNVGIGTTIISASLHVQNDGSFPGAIVTGSVGIGTLTPMSPLHVIGNIQTSGRVFSTIPTGTAPFILSSSTMVTNLNAQFLGDQSGNFYRNASNINAGILAVAFGGTGCNTYTANKLLIGNGTSPVIQSANLHWDFAQNRLGIGTVVPLAQLHVQSNIMASSFAGDGSLVTNVSVAASNIIGIVSVSNGGTGTSTFPANKLLVGNGGSAILTPNNLHWDNVNSRLGLGGITTPDTSLHMKGVLKIESASGYANAPKQYFVSDYEPFAGQYWWKVANITLQNGNLFEVDGNFSRVDGHTGYFLSILGTNNNASSNLQTYCEVTRPNTIVQTAFELYRDTSVTPNKADIYVRVTDYCWVSMRIQTTGVFYPVSWSNAAPVQTSNYYKIYDSGVASNCTLVKTQSRQIGIGLQPRSGYSIDVEGNVGAAGFFGNGTGLSNLNIGNVGIGTLSVIYGGTGTNTLTSNKLLVGNSQNPISTASDLHWTGANLGIGTTNPIAKLEVAGSIRASSIEVGSSNLVSNLNADLLDGQQGPFYQNANNINAGTLNVAYGGTGNTSFTSSKLLVGNGLNAITSPNDLHWTGVNLGVGNTNPIAKLDVSGSIRASSFESISTNLASNFNADLLDGQHGTFYQNINNINAGTLNVVYGGTGNASLVSNKLLVGNGTNAISTPTDLHWTGANLGIGTTNPATKLDVVGTVQATSLVVTSTSLASNLNADLLDGKDGSFYQNANNINTGILSVAYGGTGNTSFTSSKLLVGNGTGAITSPNDLHWTNANLGIGSTNPVAKLDVVGSIRASSLEITSINLSSNFNADLLDGQHGSYYQNANNITSGTLSVSYGGTGNTSFTSNKLLVGNGTNALSTPSDLHWTGANLGIGTANPSTKLDVVGTIQATALNVTSTVLASNLNADLLDGQHGSFYQNINNINAGTLNVAYGGTGSSTLVSNKLLVGNGSSAISTPADLHWTGANLGIGTANPLSKLHVVGTIQATSLVVSNTNLASNLNADLLDGKEGTFYQNINNINAGTLSVAYGGTGSTTLVSNKVLVGNGTNAVSTPTDLHWTGANLGIGTTTPATKLDVVGTIQATSLVVTNTNLASNLNADLLDGKDGSFYQNINNINSGTLNVAYGGTGSTSHVSNKLLVGNGTSAITSPTDLHWTGANLGIGTTTPATKLDVAGTIQATSLVVTSTNLASNLNADMLDGKDGTFYQNINNITAGVLGVTYGGTGSTSHVSNKLLVGNGTSAISTPSDLHWSGANLGIGTTNPATKLDVVGVIQATSLVVTSMGLNSNFNADLLDGQQGSFYQNANNINTGTLSVTYGGTGVTTLAASKLLVGNGTSAISTPTDLHWSGANLGVGTSNPSTKLDVAGVIQASSLVVTSMGINSNFNADLLDGQHGSYYLNASNINAGTLSVLFGGTGSSSFTSSKLLVGNGTGAINTPTDLHWSGANLGVGTTNPSTKLDVNGTIQASAMTLTSNYSMVSKGITVNGTATVKNLVALNNKAPLATVNRVVSTWTARTGIVSDTWQAVCWAPELSLFVAIGDGTTKVMTSSDGVTWTARTAAAANAWRDVCWSPQLSLFVAVAATGVGNRVMTSPDGITWTSRTSAADKDWRSVTWSPELSLFVAVAYDYNPSYVMKSSDGITWTLASTVPNGYWLDVCWSPDLSLFVAIAISNQVMISSDGNTWTGYNASFSNAEAVCWSPELSIFVAVCSSGTNRVVTSSNGINWTDRTAATNIGWKDVCWSPELSVFVAVATTNAITTHVMTSRDGIIWAARTTPGNLDLTSICWSPQLSIFVGLVGVSSGTGIVITSEVGLPNARSSQLVSPAGDVTTAGILKVAPNTDIQNRIYFTRNDTVYIGCSSFANAGVTVVSSASINTYNGSEATMFVGYSPITNRSINAAGSVQNSGQDYAEYMYKNGDFTINKGDIVGIDIQGKLTNKYDEAISFVVKSTKPSFVGGDTWATEDIVGPMPSKPTGDDVTDEQLAVFNLAVQEWQARVEAERFKVDRVAFSGQVPVNVFEAQPGDYIVPVRNQDGSICGNAVSNDNVSYMQYKKAVGKVIKILDDGRAQIIVKAC